MAMEWSFMKKTKTLLAMFFLLAFQQQCIANASSKLNISFNPASPIYHINKIIKVDGTKVYDYSEYAVKITNRYRKSVHVKSVVFKSLGNIQTSGLGDIISKWPWKNNRVLRPGKSISFKKIWGFIEDTPNDKMTSQFIFTYTLGKSAKEYTVTKNLVLTPQ